MTEQAGSRQPALSSINGELPAIATNGRGGIPGAGVGGYGKGQISRASLLRYRR